MIMQYNDYHSQVSSAWFDNKLIRKSLHNETNFNKCEFTEKRKGTSVDDLKARGKDQIRLPLPNLPFCHWSSQMFDLRAPLSNDVPLMLLNRPIYVFQLGCRNLLEVRNQKFKIQKTTEIISYNRWINWHKPWVAEANKQPTQNNSEFFSCLPL